jgi:hypothetical protein
MGHTYLSYARKKRAFFSLMWEDRGDIDEIRANAAEDHGGFMILVGLVQAYCEKQGNPAKNGIRLATQIWSMTHGIATLEASQLINLFDRSIDPESLLDHSVRTLLFGATSGEI